MHFTKTQIYNNEETREKLNVHYCVTAAQQDLPELHSAGQQAGPLQAHDQLQARALPLEFPPHDGVHVRDREGVRIYKFYPQMLLF